MADIDESIDAELGALRKGPGAHAAKLEARVGPYLRQLAGASPSGPIERDRLLTDLTLCAKRLPVADYKAVLGGLRILVETRDTTQFAERVEWLAQSTGCSTRTAQRRINSAQRMLAEEIARELQRRTQVEDPGGWYLKEFRTLLRLDLPEPVAYEERLIVATRDGLGQIRAWWDIPAADRPTEVTVEVSHGARAVTEPGPGGRHMMYIELPHRLRRGQGHRFGVEVRVAPGSSIRPHYVLTPEIRCDHFQLRVRFARDRMPMWVREIRGETVRVFDAAGPAGSVRPDQAGEIKLDFDNPTRYLGYGAKWCFRE